MAEKAPEEEKRDETDDLVGQFYIDTLPDGISKTQWKKILKKQEKTRKWLEKKEEAKLRKKERQKKLKEERKAAGLPAQKKARVDGPPRIAKGAELPGGQYRRMSHENASLVKVVLDCSFEDLMTEKDHKKLAKQIQRCYSANRRSVAPFQYYVTSFGGKLEKEFHRRCPVSPKKEYERWDVHFRPEDYIDAFGKENIVYLLAESQNVLTELDPTKAYIIGGLVDHNHQKYPSIIKQGYCYKLAQEKGLAHARLPIPEHIQLRTRSVLAINHVFEILLAYSTNGQNWKNALLQIIPPRKLQQPTESTSQPAQCSGTANSEMESVPGELSTTTEGSQSTTEVTVSDNGSKEELECTQGKSLVGTEAAESAGLESEASSSEPSDDSEDEDYVPSS